MSVFSKIKNVLFTEEEVTEEIPMITKEEVRSVPQVNRVEEKEEESRFKNIDYERHEELHVVEPKPEVRVEPKPEIRIEPKKEEKAIFQSFDEEEFDRKR